MNGKWIDTFHGLMPRRDYTVNLSAGEENGLTVKLESTDVSVSIYFGAVQAIQMLDEGVLLQGRDSEQFASLRTQNFPSTIYEIENGDFGRFVKSQMGGDLYTALNHKQYTIVAYNYVISVVSPWPPEITVAPVLRQI